MKTKKCLHSFSLDKYSRTSDRIADSSKEKLVSINFYYSLFFLIVGIVKKFHLTVLERNSDFPFFKTIVG